MKNGGILVGNSSSGIIESSYFGLPVVNIGIRQKDRERSENVIDTKDDSTQSIYLNILKAFKLKERKFKVKKFPLHQRRTILMFHGINLRLILFWNARGKTKLHKT